ncbi:efflux RND transporter periplasmic adaptor subunit [Burkholderia perseverans]|uniref:efflux RND transporter periplasmic adaptor subunit n=1 Tax=Burkholderia perseverans TaxID=2615214 RepID=UPI001FF00408|nr:efflux RND transporter periplasmic adaptor subunit [Burkholderia perseverans]
MKKGLILALTGFLVVGGSWSLLHGRGGQTSARTVTDLPREVSVAPGLLRKVGYTSSFIGHLQAVDNVQLRPRVNGYIEAVHFQEGALVKKNQLLFQIDPRPYQAEVDRLGANLAQARAELVLASANAARAARLLEQHAVSREEADRQATAERSARAQVTAAMAALDVAKLNLGYTQVRSPIDGRVSNALITQGNLVTSNDVLTSVVSVSPIYAYFDVDEQSYLNLLRTLDPEAAKTKRIQVAMALADEDGYPHPGRIDFVDNQLRESSGTIRLRAVFDNGDGAYTPGQYVRMRVDGGKPALRVLVDDRAVGTDLGNKFVYVVGADHKVAYRRVDTGPLFAGLRVINHGLKADDRIVVNGMQRIRAGVEVRSVPVSMTANLNQADRVRIDAGVPSDAASATLASEKTPAEVRKP